MKRWVQDEIDLLKVMIKQNYSHTECGEELNRSISAVQTKCYELKIISNYNKKRNTKEYQKEINDSLMVLEPYINAHTKILHKHICGHIWKAEPNSILKGKSCPKCADYGFDTSKPAVTYCLYFNKLNLYKVGITGNLNRRLKEYNYNPEVVFIRKFKTGLEAKELEKLWLKNINHLKVNTNKLFTGNTETFRI